MKELYILIFLGLVGYSTKIKAQVIVTDRPDQTESSSTIPFKSFQIESGILLGYWELGGASERLVLGPSTLFRYGFTRGIEIRLVNQYANLKITGDTSTSNRSGFMDLEIGAKIQLLKKENINTEIAFLTHLVVPSGSSGLSFGNIGTINKLAVSHTISENIGLGYNIGYAYLGPGKNIFTYSLVFGFGLTDELGVYLEPYGEWFEFEEHLANFNAGLTYLLKDNFQLDFSFGTGLNHKMNYLSVGFSWNISSRSVVKAGNKP